MSLDLTTYDFIRDTNLDYTIATNSITATTQKLSADGYVAWDYSASPVDILGGWEVQWTFNYTQLSAGSAGGTLAAWTNQLGGWRQWLNGGATADYISAEAYAVNNSTYWFFIRCGKDGASGINSPGALVLNKSTTYYGTFKTDANASTNGDAILEVHSDAARTTLVGTETVSLTSPYSGLTFDYFQAHSAVHHTSSGATATSVVSDYVISGFGGSLTATGSLSTGSAAISGSATHSSVGSYDSAGSLSTSAATISGAAINAGGGLPPAVLQSSIKEFFTDSSGSPLMAGVVKIKILQDATNYSYDFSDNTIKASASVATLQGSLTAVDATYWAGWYEIDVITSNLADGSYTFYIEETTTNQHRYSSFTYKAGLVAQAPTASENADAVWAKTLP
jgi:hypothetical protein